MRAEVFIRGKVKAGSRLVSYTSSCPYQSYNSGGILSFTHQGEKKRYGISIYEAQCRSSCDRIVRSIIEK